jgi:hypothetical protein
MAIEEYTVDPFTSPPEAPEQVVVAVLPHPLHGRLVEKVILWVRPNLDLQGARYKLTWWSDGVAYYKPVCR